MARTGLFIINMTIDTIKQNKRIKTQKSTQNMSSSTCYNKSVPSIWGYIMNFIRNTILTLILLTPIVVLATSEMRADDLEEVGVEQTIVEEIIDEVQPDEVVQDPVKAQIQEVFGDNWEMAYAVMFSESSGRVKAKNVNSDRHSSIDRGLFQINSYWNPDVSVECAFDMVCNINEAYRISKGGTDWTPWYGYTNGNYRKYL